jgi:hypothetical protein
MTTTVSGAVAPWLSRDEAKRERYADDLYFCEGWQTFQAACAGRPAEAMLSRLTFLLVKPEAIAGRRVRPVLEFLQEHGYRVLGTWPLRMGRHQVRGLWGYQLNAVPVAHVRALEMLAGAGELFLAGLGHQPGAGGTSAAELLAERKSSPGDGLRERLGCPALMINFVHAPDEPADVLRELAVLFDARAQRRIMTTMLAAAGWPEARFAATAPAAAALMTSRYPDCPAHDLDVPATLRRLRLGARAGAGLPAVTRAAIEAGRVAPEDALEVVASLEAATGLPRWDRVVAAAYLVDGLRTGRHPLVGPPRG